MHDPEFAPSERVITEQTLPALQKLKDAGKVKQIGMTGYPLRVQKSILEKVRCERRPPPVARGVRRDLKKHGERVSDKNTLKKYPQHSCVHWYSHVAQPKVSSVCYSTSQARWNPGYSHMCTRLRSRVRLTSHLGIWTIGWILRGAQASVPVDMTLTYCHYTLNDTTLLGSEYCQHPQPTSVGRH